MLCKLVLRAKSVVCVGASDFLDRLIVAKGVFNFRISVIFYFFCVFVRSKSPVIRREHVREARAHTEIHLDNSVDGR